jgi:hypothetical protein
VLFSKHRPCDGSWNRCFGLWLPTAQSTVPSLLLRPLVAVSATNSAIHLLFRISLPRNCFYKAQTLQRQPKSIPWSLAAHSAVNSTPSPPAAACSSCGSFFPSTTASSYNSFLLLKQSSPTILFISTLVNARGSTVSDRQKRRDMAMRTLISVRRGQVVMPHTTERHLQGTFSDRTSLDYPRQPKGFQQTRIIRHTYNSLWMNGCQLPAALSGGFTNSSVN